MYHIAFFTPKNVKKMCSRKKLSSQSELQSFTYPKLHTGKSWYIDFLAFDPAEGKMKRKKYTLDNIPTKTQRRVRAAELIASTLNLLRTGFLYSCLENPVDRGAWWAPVHRVAQSWTRLKQLSTHALCAE